MSRALVLRLGLFVALAAAVPCVDDATQHCPACEFVGGHLVIHAHSAKDFNFHCAKQPNSGLCACKSHANGVKTLEMHGKVVHLSVGSQNAEPTVSSNEVDGDTVLEGLSREQFEQDAQRSFKEALAPRLGVQPDEILIVSVRDVAPSSTSIAASAVRVRRRRLLRAYGSSGLRWAARVRWKYVQATAKDGSGREHVADVEEVAEDLALPNSAVGIEASAMFFHKLCTRCAVSRTAACHVCEAGEMGLVHLRFMQPVSYFCEALRFGMMSRRVCCPSSADVCSGRAKCRSGCPCPQCSSERKGCHGTHPLCAPAAFSRFRCLRRARLGCRWSQPNRKACWGWSPLCETAQYEARCRFFSARGLSCWWSNPHKATPAPTPDPCQDGAPKKQSCARYKLGAVGDGEERGRMTYCDLARTQSTRRRSWGADAYKYCRRTCGICMKGGSLDGAQAPKHVSGTSAPTCGDAKPENAKSCEQYALSKISDAPEKSSLTVCEFARLPETSGRRRRTWARDAKAHCRKTCKLCTPKICQGVAHPACLSAQNNVKLCRSLATKYGCYVELDGGCTGGAHPACHAALNDEKLCKRNARVGCIWQPQKEAVKQEADANSNSPVVYPVIVRHSCTHSNRVRSTKWHRGSWGCQYGRIRGTPSFVSLQQAQKACSRAPFVGGAQGCSGVMSLEGKCSAGKQQWSAAMDAAQHDRKPGKFVICAAFRQYGTPSEACCKDTSLNQLERCDKYATLSPSPCENAFTSTGRRRRNFGHDARANCQKTCGACTTKRKCGKTCFWQYDQFRRRQYSHRFKAHECTNGLPQGQCVVSLRSASVSQEDQDWEAFGPGEQSLSMGGYPVWDGNWTAGDAGFRFTNWDQKIEKVHVDYLCNADGLAKLPGQFSCHYRNVAGHKGVGVLEHRFSAKECGGAVPKGNCFVALHRARAMGDKHHNWQILGPRDGVTVSISSTDSTHGSLVGMWDRQTQLFNAAPVWKMRGQNKYLFKYVMANKKCRWAMRAVVSDTGNAPWFAVKTSASYKLQDEQCKDAPFAQSRLSWMVWGGATKKWQPADELKVEAVQMAFVSGSPYAPVLNNWLDPQPFKHEAATVWKLRGQKIYLFKYTPPHGRCRWAFRHRPDTVGSGGYLMVTSDKETCRKSPFLPHKWYSWTSKGWVRDTRTLIETTGHASVLWFNSQGDQNVDVKADFLCDQEEKGVYKTRSLDNTIHHCQWSANRLNDAKRRENTAFWRSFDAIWIGKKSRFLAHEFDLTQCTNGIPKGECTVGIRRQAPYNGGNADSWSVLRTFKSILKAQTKSWMVKWYQRYVKGGEQFASNAEYDIAIDFICEPISFKMRKPGAFCSGWTASLSKNAVGDSFSTAAQCAHACRFTSGCRNFMWGKGRFKGACHMAKTSCNATIASADWDMYELTRGMTHDIYGHIPPIEVRNKSVEAPAPSPTWPSLYPLESCQLGPSWDVDGAFAKCKEVDLGPKRLPLYMFAPPSVSDLALEQAVEVQRRQLVGLPAFFTNFLHFKGQRMVLWNGDGSHVTTVKAVYRRDTLEFLSHRNIDNPDRAVCVTDIPSAARANNVLMQRTFDPAADPRYASTTIQQNINDVQLGENCSATPAELAKNPQDKHKFCSKWAAAGQCTTNPRFMSVQCAHSCTMLCCSNLCACARRYATGLAQTQQDFHTKFPQISVRASHVMCYDDIADPEARQRLGAANLATWVHETAVLVEFGLLGQFHPSQFSSLSFSFENALLNNLWNNTEALLSQSAYFAALAEAYLGIGTLKVPSGLPGTVPMPMMAINSRTRLRGYDPMGYAFVKTVYPPDKFPENMSLALGCPSAARPVNFHEHGHPPPKVPEIGPSALAPIHGSTAIGLDGLLRLAPLKNGKYSLMDRNGTFLSATSRLRSGGANFFAVDRTNCNPSTAKYCFDQEKLAMHGCNYYATEKDNGNTYCAIARATSTRRRSWGADAAKHCRRTCRMCTLTEHGDNCPMEEFTLYRPATYALAVRSRNNRWLSFDGRRFSLSECNPVLNPRACSKELFTQREVSPLLTPRPTPAPAAAATVARLISCSRSKPNANDMDLQVKYKYHRFAKSECTNMVTGQPELPSGSCVVALRRTAACLGFDWAAQGPHESQRSIYGSGKDDCKGIVRSTRHGTIHHRGDCSRAAGAAVSWSADDKIGGTQCTDADIAVDYICGSSSSPLPPSYTSCGHLRRLRLAKFNHRDSRRRRAGYAHARWQRVGNDCTHGLPQGKAGQCFETLHRARSGVEQSSSRNDRWSVQRTGMHYFGKERSFDVRADYLCDLDQRENLLRTEAGKPLTITVCEASRYDHLEERAWVHNNAAYTRLSVHFKDSECTNGAPVGNCAVGIRSAVASTGWDYDWRAFGPKDEMRPGVKGAGMSWLSHLTVEQLKAQKHLGIVASASYACDQN